MGEVLQAQNLSYAISVELYMSDPLYDILMVTARSGIFKDVQLVLLQTLHTTIPKEKYQYILDWSKYML